MPGFESVRNERPWDDDRFPIQFVGSGKDATIVFTGGKVSGDEELLAQTYQSSTSLADFIQKSEKAGLSVHASELLRVELGLQD